MKGTPYRRAGWLLIALLSCGTVNAHVSSTGFLDLHVSDADINGSVELAVRDAELAIGVDADRDGKVTWSELRAAEPALERYVGTHLQLAADGGSCPLRFQGLAVNDRVDGNYAWLPFTAHCGAPVRQLHIRYSVLRDIDPSHRGLVALTAGSVAQSGVLGEGAQERVFAVHAPAAWQGFVEYFRAGVWHILSGIDHLLFLLSLLLPAVLLRTHGRWEPVARARPALVGVVKVVTAFTLAHSITLTLAALQIVRLPSRLTESVIAASIIVAALNNIFPLVTERRARIAFAFGLLHGFGFASVLQDMGLPAGARLLSLFAFNLGIEAGQFAVVLAVMPVIYGMRSGVFYRRGVMPWGSAAIAALALVWFVQRAILPTG